MTDSAAVVREPAPAKPRRPMTSDEFRMIDSLAHAPHIKEWDQRVVAQLFRATLHAGAPTLTEGQATVARTLVLKYRSQMAGIVVAMAET